jgi:hypothetical protein
VDGVLASDTCAIECGFEALKQRRRDVVAARVRMAEDEVVIPPVVRPREVMLELGSDPIRHRDCTL